ncbi:hypothetical protein CO057_01675 [Candidatus Uhrbacteria bacterium CG_4_9_14_0_2_um_filter_41_50]|uniref:Transcription regulator TrmB N-terminal domain-containing protein n=1 Tax=Candidatus Uhrbacteria bacterium CG_4_9_14_0_2_um_filter_41_50 TaxID=1975031 RepID=A0A2M8EPH3_9BACT|nr:MAG: hypothetical protein COZ45_00855 [Candidatus Uhrbacteria bacterium CG_4_10_14_3_um_filter_41_21]PIZ55407.1 MAG: hypothetical protein COY24_00360 [Candidatus Uhrbacteria bacterium CG_4_10_14_0_2_um_filter_41_21]PJB85077.1 MAG: hypothetical protein CO086_00175 [Candidatus Uhrbacteria bacterium CG_4_9_14_0_8_um_filter_41_16]PJC24638.1 MAG: hypothetical protein CO057_01675 [Candidatus Uhrbacteria bacterium CG_4_9_14_0_2_um_filter_41_50]PJE75180.1 MAG: hypothetical protein COV03_01415 [Candi
MKRKIILDAETLELLGLKSKDLEVYVALLRLGSAPLRKIATECSLSRATAYDSLKRLKSAVLVSYVDAKSHRYFVAEDPQKLRGLATRREVALQEARQTLDDLLPELQNIIGEAGHRPAVRYFEGDAGVKDVLKDVLSTTSRTKTKTYRVYSSSGIRDLILAAWPKYNARRKAVKVRVKAVSVDEGGKTVGLDERRWLSKAKGGAPTYIFIYGNKTAYVAADEKERLFCVVIDDQAIASTQQMIFEALWQNLG